MEFKKRFMSMAFAMAVTASAIPMAAPTSKAADTQLFINEVCTQNKSCLSDGYGTYSDWIELYNSGTSPIDLSGYGLSDKAAEPLKWTFPTGTVIESGEHMVVFASNLESMGSEFHTNFSLSKNGETVVLSSPDGSILQQVEVPTLGEDYTYGRTPDGSSVFEIMNATPAAENIIVASAPVFSADSGFYGTDFSLTLTAAENCEIYYTTDGTNPITSDTAQKYSSGISVKDRTNEPNIYSEYAENESSATSVSRGTGYQKPPFNVDKATVVRAAAKNSDGTFSNVVSQTYFITSGNLSQYKNMTVVSLVTDPENLFDPDKGIYVTGNQYLAWRNSGNFDYNKSPWDTDNISNFFSKGREWEREATLTFIKNGNTVVEQNMGIRIKGASTRNTPQKSFNLYARSEYGASKINYPIIENNYDINGNLIDKYDSVCLRSVSDEARLRDGFAQKLVYERDNITNQDMESCVVFLNGEYWGLYEMTEKFSDYFIESNYGIQKENVAMIKNGELEEGDDYIFDEYMNFMYDYADRDMTNAANYQAVCDYIDIDSYIEHYAAGLYLGTYDWPNYNYGLWKNTGEAIEGNSYSDGKWRFISFDYDYTMGATYADFGGVEGYAYDSFRHMEKAYEYEPTNLFLNLLKNKEFRNKFVNVYCDYANEVLTPEKGNAMADFYLQNYTEKVSNSILRWWGFFGGSKESNLSYNRQQYTEKNIPGIKQFFNERASYTLDDMKNFLGLAGNMQTITLKTNGGGKIMINSITPDTSKGSWSGKYFSDVPVTLIAVPDDNASFTGWGGDASGTEQTITVSLSKAMSITADFGEKKEIKGDVNKDGSFTVADLVMLEKWLLGSGDITDWKAGDLYDDDILDVYDMCLMRGKITEK